MAGCAEGEHRSVTALTATLGATNDDAKSGCEIYKAVRNIIATLLFRKFPHTWEIPYLDEELRCAAFILRASRDATARLRRGRDQLRKAREPK